MNTLTQIARFRQSVVTYSYNFSIKKAVLHFNVSRATIYRWRKKYDGSANSLNDLSRRPHSHPNQQLYPGQRIQIDVKHVPSACIAGDARVMGDSYYQFTAIDEYSRFRYLAAFKDESSFSAATFVKQLVKAFPFPIECIQTDNGPEFTNLFTSKKGKPTLFQLTLNNMRPLKWNSPAQYIKDFLSLGLLH